ncbi:MAG: S24 family peptidase [Candidatus Methylomirabilia bacterium]
MASEAYRRLRSDAGEGVEAGGCEASRAVPSPGANEGRSDTGEAGRRETASSVPSWLRIVDGLPEERYVTCVPLIPLKVAAGAFSDPQHIEDDGFGWVAIKTRRKLRRGMFVAQVVGKSMEPMIPDGAYCLFAAPVEGSRRGKTVLVQLRDAIDTETGERYTVKRYESEKTKKGDSWQHARITLKPLNPDFAPIVLTGGEGELSVIAELVEVLGQPNSAEFYGLGTN